MQRDRVVAELLKRLGGRPRQNLVNYLDRRGFIEEVVIGASALDDLEREARDLLDIAAPEADPVNEPIAASRVGAPGDRGWALSHLVAAHAGTDRDVVTFREKHLPGGLVPWSELSDWIHAKAREETTTVDVTLTLPRDALRHSRGVIDIERIPAPPPVTSVKVRSLDYAGPDDEGVSRIAVSAGGVLDAARALGTKLADSFGWRPVQATAFLLSDVVPLIPSVRRTVSGFKIRHGIDLVWARRITLDIDPAAEEEQVVAAYRQARREMGLGRRGTLSPKHTRLAVFALVEHAELSWRSRFEAWNDDFPDWSYSQESNFRRDAARAGGRLMLLGRRRS